VRCPEAEGVECVFGIPGEENIRFVDALNGSGIRYVLVRHEQAMSIPPSSPPSTRLGWCASPQRTACGYFTPR
jgi:thiamine pyrophosphate-dependent enzyme